MLICTLRRCLLRISCTRGTRAPCTRSLARLMPCTAPRRVFLSCSSVLRAALTRPLLRCAVLLLRVRRAGGGVPALGPQALPRRAERQVEQAPQQAQAQRAAQSCCGGCCACACACGGRPQQLCAARCIYACCGGCCACACACGRCAWDEAAQRKGRHARAKAGAAATGAHGIFAPLAGGEQPRRARAVWGFVVARGVAAAAAAAG